MASAVARELDRLKSLDKYSRPARAQYLSEQELLKLDGSTLFRYHTVPSYHVSWNNKFVLLGHAEFEAGVAWAKLNMKQLMYWARQTENLLAGSIGPLHPETFDNFNTGKLSLSDGSESECGPEDLSETLVDISPQDSLPTYPVLTPKSTDSPNRQIAHSDDQAATSSDKSDAVSNAPSHCSSAPDKPTSVSEYMSVLGASAKDAPFIHLYVELSDMFSVDGHTLFFHHASARAAIAISGSWGHDDAEELMVAVWNSMPGRERQPWADWTSVMREDLRQCKRKGLNYLYLDGKLSMPDLLRKASEALDLAYTKPTEVPGPDTMASSQATSPNGQEQRHRGRISLNSASGTPVLDFLYGGSAVDIGVETVVETVLSAVKIHIHRNPTLQLQGRHKCIRISYAPSTDDVTSIASRLRAVFRVGETDGNGFPISNIMAPRDSIHLRLERLLRPFVAWNHHFFPQFDRAKDIYKVHWKDYGSAWHLFQRQYVQLVPITHGKHDKTVSVLMNAIRERARHAGNDYGFLTSADNFDNQSVGKGKVSPEQLRQWSLADNKNGFAQKLLTCFERDDLTPEDYGDMIEQRLASLCRRAPDIFFKSTGIKSAGKGSAKPGGAAGHKVRGNAAGR